MKHLIEVGGLSLILDTAKLEAVYKLLDTCEHIEQTYKGDNKGTRGDRMQYIDEIKPLDARWLKATVMSQDYYDTLKLLPKL